MRGSGSDWILVVVEAFHCSPPLVPGTAQARSPRGFVTLCPFFFLQLRLLRALLLADSLELLDTKNQASKMVDWQLIAIETRIRSTELRFIHTVMVVINWNGHSAGPQKVFLIGSDNRRTCTPPPLQCSTPPRLASSGRGAPDKSHHRWPSASLASPPTLLRHSTTRHLYPSHLWRLFDRHYFSRDVYEAILVFLTSRSFTSRDILFLIKSMRCHTWSHWLCASSSPTACPSRNRTRSLPMPQTVSFSPSIS